MDALDVPKASVMGGSAGALSALQVAVLHPDRVSALILLVPLGYKPPSEANSAEPKVPMVESTMMWVPVTPKGGDVQPYLLVTGILLVCAFGCLIKPGPALAKAPIQM